VKLTDIQLRLLAPLRNTTTVERPLNLTRGTAGKVVAKLRAEGFMRHSNDLPPCPVQSTPIVLASIGCRQSHHFDDDCKSPPNRRQRCNFPLGLSGIKNGAPISQKRAKGRRRGLWDHPPRRPERLKLD
jgi:hypothetical protein